MRRRPSILRSAATVSRVRREDDKDYWSPWTGPFQGLIARAGQRVNPRHPFTSTVAVTRIHGSASHTTGSRSTAAVKLAGQLAQDRPRDIEVVPGGRFEHSLHSRFDGSGRFAIQRLSLPCQSQEPPTPIAFVGPSADQTATLESLQDVR